ncbi:MAG TPA: molybdenum cofactor guanylyltransferase [Candidatus Dormibacteraeota bacterium]|jgi:molybdopterin-guanine dinucleotide biosynthesis protein A|nr:molybdenum cofactor guanylyltransferase [Candidatus Dormibacteraeota bacterium]
MVSRNAASAQEGSQPSPQLAGLVLCGGHSRRMGIDKALLQVDGGPLVLRVASRLADVADPVLLAPGVPGRFAATGYAEVADVEPARGPLGGLVAGLLVSPHPNVAVVAVDMPYASPAVIRLLARVCADGAWDAALPVTSSGPEPLHAVYSQRAAGPLRAALADGRLAMHHAIADLRIALLDREAWGDADPSGRFAANLNTREDLALLA